VVARRVFGVGRAAIPVIPRESGDPAGRGIDLQEQTANIVHYLFILEVAMNTSFTSGLFGVAGLGTPEHRKVAVWWKGRVIPGFDAAVWRHDAFGHVIRFSDYGDRASQYGWEIDHVLPTALGGADTIDNLRPLHCTNNAGLGGILGALMK
jgi:hypothetical protein